MFIRKLLYENGPYYWIVLGVLLIAVGIYYGNAGNEALFLGGLVGGVFAAFWGLFIVRRRLSQATEQPYETYDEYLDQTCELNLTCGPIIDAVPDQSQD